VLRLCGRVHCESSCRGNEYDRKTHVAGGFAAANLGRFRIGAICKSHRVAASVHELGASAE